eukprot:COSAG05_NODE_18985_length_299_cov_1.510000_1_plen_57_part_01
MPRREIGAEEQEGLVRQVHRAIALEEKGRFAQAAGKFEAALKTYREAGHPRPKLQQR